MSIWDDAWNQGETESRPTLRSGIHVDKVWSGMLFDRWVNQTYFAKQKALKRGTYNPKRALQAF